MNMEWRIKSADVLALALAGNGRAEEAEPLAQEALALAAQTDFLNIHGDASLALTEVLLLLDRPQDAVRSAQIALELFERKGNVASAGKTRRFLADLSRPRP